MKVQRNVSNCAADVCCVEFIPASIREIADRATAKEEAALIARAGGDAKTASKLERKAADLRRKYDMRVSCRRASLAQRAALRSRQHISTKVMDDAFEVLVAIARLRGIEPKRLASVLLEEAIYAVEALPPTGQPSIIDFMLNAAPAGPSAWGTRRAQRIKEISAEVLAVEALLARVA